MMVPPAMAVPVAAGSTMILVGLMPRDPTPANVQPEVPRQFVLAGVEVSLSSQMGETLNELLMWVFHFLDSG
jgi:hypothetical protein